MTRSWMTLLFGLTATCAVGCREQITPPPPPPPVAADVTLSLGEFALSVGGSIQLDATVADASGNAIPSPDVTWESSDNAILSVQANGTMATVTAAAAGSATITATVDAVNGTCDGDVVAQALYASDVQNVFNNNCAFGGCHLGPTAPFGLDLSPGVSYDSLVNVASGQLSSMDRIEPDDPATSYLIHKIRGTQFSVGGGGVQMPPTGPLPDSTINVIRAWVQAGAVNN